MTNDRERLWNLLDDIDTLDDMAKDSDDTYRTLVRRVVQKRFRIARPGDGWNAPLEWANDAD